MTREKRGILLSVAVCLAVASGCGEEKKPNPCERLPELCPLEGVRRCTSDGLAFETCQRNLDGCLVWGEATACGERKECRSTGTDATCQCSNECSAKNETTCSGDRRKLLICRQDASNCLYLEEQEDCNQSGKVCYPTPKPAVCDLPCTDKCNSAGATRCSGTVIESCAPVGRCLDWVVGTDCAVTGQNCMIVSGNAQCQAPCTHNCPAIGVTRCVERTIQACVLIDGCRDWVLAVDCAQEGKYCYDGGGQVARCVEQCNHTCDAENDTRCQPGTQVIQTCTVDQNGCRSWVDTLDCAGTSQLCREAGGSPECVDACQNECTTIDATQCSGNDIQTCQLNQQDGCNYWVTTGSCSGDTPRCDDTSGQALCVCEDLCPAHGNRQCQHDVLQTCAVDGDADDCLEWKDMLDCTSVGKACDATLTPPACCAHQCDTLDTARCDPDAGSEFIQTCHADDDGCRFWENTTDCSASSQVCDDSGGSPQCM